MKKMSWKDALSLEQNESWSEIVALYLGGVLVNVVAMLVFSVRGMLPEKPFGPPSSVFIVVTITWFVVWWVGVACRRRNRSTERSEDQ